MNRHSMMIAAATIAGLATAVAQGRTSALGDEAFTTLAGTSIVWPTEVEAKVRLRLAAAVHTDDAGKVSLDAAMVEGPDGTTGISRLGSIDLASIEMETTSPGEFEDLLAPGSLSGSGVVSGSVVSLASSGSGTKGMPSTSETESSGFSWPGTGSTQDGQNLASGERQGGSGVFGTDLPPAHSVPGSGAATFALMGLASALRRRRR